jgi:hypothetical protein
MSPQNINNNDIIMDLEIPYYVYIALFIIVAFILIYKQIYPNEELFDFIEKYKKDSLNLFSKKENKLLLLTKLNTKINRDYLDNSKYYYEKGYNKIYENNKLDIKENKKILEKDGNNEKVYITKIKKVGFSNNIIYENDF